jgi:hypothetical protein
LVHFFQDIDQPAVREQIAVEQLNAWHGLVGLLKGQWSDAFDRFDLDLEGLDLQFAEHRLYLKTRFDSLAPELEALKATGKVLQVCVAAASTQLRTKKCLANWNKPSAMCAISQCAG